MSKKLGKTEIESIIWYENHRSKCIQMFDKILLVLLKVLDSVEHCTKPYNQYKKMVKD